MLRLSETRFPPWGQDWVWRRSPLHLRLKEVPHATTDNRPIFPNLKSVSFMKCRVPPPINFGWDPASMTLGLSLVDTRVVPTSENKSDCPTTILSNVETVYLVQPPMSFQSSNPSTRTYCKVNFSALGLTNLKHGTEVVCSHELRSQTDLLACLGRSSILESITYDFTHCDHSFSFSPVNGLETRRDMTVPITAHADSLACMMTHVAYLNRPPSPLVMYPGLQRVTLNLGHVGLSTLRDFDLDVRILMIQGRHSIRLLLEGIADQMRGYSFTLKDLEVRIPDFIISLGTFGPSWKLAGRPFPTIKDSSGTSWTWDRIHNVA